MDISMNKIIYTLIFISIFVQKNNAQLDDLLRLKTNLEKKVSVGSTTEEVKKILRKPKAIESGFPKTDEILPLEFPEQVGQLNNSTWFYFLPVRKIVHNAPAEAICYLNGFKVNQDLYEAYATLDSIYLYKGKPAYLYMAEGYKVLKDPELKSVKKEIAGTSIKILKPCKVTSSFIPVLCVIFDKGTQAVAATKVFFQIASD
jgi:hypothetical protein